MRYRAQLFRLAVTVGRPAVPAAGRCRSPTSARPRPQREPRTRAASRRLISLAELGFETTDIFARFGMGPQGAHDRDHKHEKSDAISRPDEAGIASHGEKIG